MIRNIYRRNGKMIEYIEQNDANESNQDGCFNFEEEDDLVILKFFNNYGEINYKSELQEFNDDRV